MGEYIDMDEDITHTASWANMRSTSWSDGWFLAIDNEDRPPLSECRLCVDDPNKKCWVVESICHTNNALPGENSCCCASSGLSVKECSCVDVERGVLRMLKMLCWEKLVVKGGGRDEADRPCCLLVVFLWPCRFPPMLEKMSMEANAVE